MGRYHLFGQLWLDDPLTHLSHQARDRLYRLQPYLRALSEAPHSSNLAGSLNLRPFNVRQEFAEFQATESALWSPPRPSNELVRPSGSQDWPLAHHLHNPSFTTLQPYNEETEDDTNPRVWLIMANNFVPGKTLIFDHLARREIVDGLKMYPKEILACHERWLSRIRESISSKVEIVYG
jgi:hypothetical protein